jgi:hypothetical protein
MSMNAATIKTNIASNGEQLSDDAMDMAETLFDAKLIALMRAELPRDHFPTTGDVILSLQYHVEHMMQKYGAWPTADQNTARARLDAMSRTARN